MAKINIDDNLYERIKQSAAQHGFSSVDELITSALEHELEKLGEEAEKQVADQLRGLGYIE